MSQRRFRIYIVPLHRSDAAVIYELRSHIIGNLVYPIRSDISEAYNNTK